MADKKHILILPRWYPNKTDIQLGTFIEEQALLMKDDFHVHLIYVQALDDMNQQFKIQADSSKGIDERIVYFKSASGPFRKLINLRRYRKAQQMAYVLEPFEPVLCHVHVPYRPAMLALKLNKKGVPFVITEHWSGHLTAAYDQKNSADKKLYKKVLKKAAGIATVSQLLQAKFKENTGFDSIVIPNLIQQADTGLSANSEKIELLSVADLTDRVKNISGLIEAFYEAHQQNKQLQLTIIGGGPDAAYLKKLIAEKNLNEEVVMRGRLSHDEVLSAYQNCDFYVCNSNFETFGMAVAEALAAGKPVISTRCGGPQEFLSEENSIVIPTKDQTALSIGILKMAEDYKNYDQKAISRQIMDRFGANTVRKKLSEFYTGVKQDSSKNH
ncbi:MAG: glycosyltransferase [Crocinitomicaceae bacterium]